jgi:hypothetical protein
LWSSGTALQHHEKSVADTDKKSQGAERRSREKRRSRGRRASHFDINPKDFDIDSFDPKDFLWPVIVPQIHDVVGSELTGETTKKVGPRRDAWMRRRSF